MKDLQGKTLKAAFHRSVAEGENLGNEKEQKGKPRTERLRRTPSR
jgi:hypothetical protein